jgi:sugar O-acyltransferase (sialic acid O-acetyltransferase NeuD family)
MKEFALIGAGGFAREVQAHMGRIMPCFVDDVYWSPNAEHIYPLSQFKPENYKVLIAIGDSEARRIMAEKLPQNTEYFNFLHPSAQILNTATVEIGEGSIICANTIITTDCKIGKHAHLNLGTTIGHDCVIGDYFTTAPTVSISGNCKIGDCVYIGTNACVREKISICSNVTIGMMSAVVKNIEQSGKHFGVPSKFWSY